MNCALITGSTSVLGEAIARKLCYDLKLHIILHYHKNEIKAKTLQQELIAKGGSADIIQFDVISAEEVNVALSDWKAENSDKKITVLVNNAGILKDNLMVFTSEEDWRSVMDVKILGFYHVTSPILKDMMLNRYGRIINIASLRGINGGRGQVNYSAANGALISATSALSKEAGPRNVTVNAVAPGFIESEMTASVDAETWKKFIPLGRFGKPDEVAGVVAFLASEASGYVTGATIPVTGGLI
jgi:3-oxoacyl-[acyl-carrier protein] reductase